MYEHVLVATDGSDAADVAAEHGVELARRYGATLHALYVIETRTAYDNAIVDPEVVRRNLRREGEKATAAIRALADDAGVQTITTVERGVPHETIVDYADEHRIDIVVMGRKGASEFKTILLGSTTDAVVRTTRIPVLVVGNA